MTSAGETQLMSRCPEVREVRSREAWNELVLRFRGADVRQSFEWGEVRAEAGWTPRRYAVFQEGECVACLSVLIRRIPATGLSVLYAPRGPLMDLRSPVAWRGVRTVVEELARQTRAIVFRVSPPALGHDGSASEALVEHGFVPLRHPWSTWNSPLATMLLDVTGSEEEIMGRMERGSRKHLRKLLKGGLSLRLETSREAVREFHRGLVRFARRKRFPVRGEGYFQRLGSEFAPPEGQLSFVEQDGVPVAGAFALRFGRHAYALFYYADDGHASVSRLSDWDTILWALKSGCEVVDFGSPRTQIPPSPAEPGYGIYRYKLALGCSLVQFLGYHDLVLKPASYRLFRAVEDRILPSLWDLRARLNR